MKNVFLTISAAVFLLVLAGCTREPLNNLTVDESRIYITNHDDSVSFGNFKTFSIADSVAVISNNKLQAKAFTETDTAYINAVKNQLIQRGFTPVSKDQHPDLGVDVSRIYNTYTGVIDYSGYGGDYYGYWDPYYW